MDTQHHILNTGRENVHKSIQHPDTAGGAAASHQLCKSPTDTGLPNQTSIDQSIDWEDKSTNKSMIVS